MTFALLLMSLQPAKPGHYLGSKDTLKQLKILCCRKCVEFDFFKTFILHRNM